MTENEKRKEQAVEKRYSLITRHVDVPLYDLLEAVEHLMTNTCFQFNNKYYKQLYGTPMGSPVSPRFADMVMDDLETDCLARMNFKPIFYGRYVDDIFTIIPKDKINEMLELFNSYDDRLKFTHEIEVDGKIDFLEVSIIKENNKLITDWFHKPTFSGRFLNFNSNHPLSHKRGIIYMLVDRAIELSHKRFRYKNVSIIKKYLKNNGYPMEFINFHIKKRIFSKHNNRNTSSGDNIGHNYKEVNCNRNSLQVPYVKNTFEKLSKKLSKYNISVIPKISHNLSNVIRRGKDITSKFEQNNVVYQINCKNCNATYVGETKRKLKDRVREHVSCVEKSNIQSVIFKHVSESNHTFEFDKTKILDKESNWRKRILAEMVFINAQDNSINKKTDTNNLHSAYEPLIKKYCKL